MLTLLLPSGSGVLQEEGSATTLPRQCSGPSGRGVIRQVRSLQAAGWGKTPVVRTSR
jgi:hypothetical protein